MVAIIIIGVICILSIIVLIIVENADRREELEQAKDKYFRSLDELKNNSNNPDIRQETLQLGRDYSNLTRKKRGVTIYDEMALMNDINAACAGATVSSAKEIANNATIEERLAKLSELKERNLINEEEYYTRRQKILDEI